MMNLLRERICGAAESMPSLSDLIDKVLDWIEELSSTMAPVAISGLVCCEAEARVLLD